MTRLPTPGQDDGTWGDILNQYLDVSHNADGSLKSSAVTVAGAASDSSVVHNSGNETIGGVKTFSSSPVVPNPTNTTDAANKTYVDNSVSAGAPDASPTTKGIVQLTNDLGGTATAPTVPGLANKADKTITISAGTGLTGGGDLSTNRTLTVSYGTTAGTAAQGNDNRITGAVQSSTVTNKGDLLAATAASTVARQGVGSDGQVLTADSTQTTGIKWNTPTVGAQNLSPTAVKTSGYAASPGDYVPVDTTSGSVIITLPTAPADGSRIGLKHVIQGSANTVTFNTGGSDVFNKAGGTTSGALTLLNQAVVLQYKASSAIWYVQSDDIPLTQLDARYTPLSGRVANVRRLLNLLKPSDYAPLTLTSDIPTVTVSTTATLTARVAGPQTGEVTEVGTRGTWDTTFGRLPVSQLSGLDMVHNGTAVEIAIFAGFTGTLPVWVFVDGQPATATPDTTSVGSVTSSTTYYIKVTFGAARRRRIEFFCPMSGSWYAVRCAISDTLEPAQRRPVIAWIGDSFYGGSNATTGLASAHFLASRQLGVECYASAFGGTGYSTAGSFTKFGDSSRVANVAKANPDLIVLQGSVNDDGQGTIGTDAAATFAAYRAACPGASFIVLGPQPSNATNTLSTNRSTNIAAVKTAALAEPSVIAFHDMVGTAAGVPATVASFQTYPDGTLVKSLGSVWQVMNGGASYSNGPSLPPTASRFALKTWAYYGTGQVGTTTGDGNRDTLLYSDGVHPMPATSQAFADMTVAKIRADLAAYVLNGTINVD